MTVLFLSTAQAAETKTAVFAGGCFWSMEKDFDKLKGVVSTTSGYSGGHVANPTYEQVSKGDTGHFESVKVEYDPAQVSYEQVVMHYWHHTDPLDGRGQFCDKGAEYHPVIFYGSEEEKAVAEKTKAEVEKQLQQSVATQILPAAPFYPAEEYHQDFYLKNPAHYKAYRFGCGRDSRIEEIWGAE